MSRSRNIEPEAAVQAAQKLFWKHGFYDLGTRQIEQETGLTRFTLQKSYGGKKALFLRTLDLYLDIAETRFLPEVGTDNLEALASWFEQRADPEKMPEISCYGCLMINTIIEFHGQDTDINQRKDRFFKLLREIFHAHLSIVIKSDDEVQAKSEILMGIILALNVVIRAADNNAAGQKLANSTARMIREW